MLFLIFFKVGSFTKFKDLATEDRVELLFELTEPDHLFDFSKFEWSISCEIEGRGKGMGRACEFSSKSRLEDGLPDDLECKLVC